MLTLAVMVGVMRTGDDAAVLRAVLKPTKPGQVISVLDQFETPKRLPFKMALKAFLGQAKSVEPGLLRELKRSAEKGSDHPAPVPSLRWLGLKVSFVSVSKVPTGGVEQLKGAQPYRIRQYRISSTGRLEEACSLCPPSYSPDGRFAVVKATHPFAGNRESWFLAKQTGTFWKLRAQG